MSLFENFPYTNLHNLNLDWLIAEIKKCYSPDNPPESMVISVNGESGVVTLYRNAHVSFPDVQNAQWNIYRGSDGKITGIEFNKDNPATRINGNQRFVIYDAGNPPPYPVLSVNGQTGAVTLYPEAYVEFPPEEGNNWGIQRTINDGTADETMVGLMFDDTGKAYITHDEEASQLLTIDDIPSSSGVVSINGSTGVVILNGANTPSAPNSGKTINQKTEDVKKSIAITENGNVATHNIPKGSYVLWLDNAYIAKTNISINDTLSTSNLESISNGFVNKATESVIKQLTPYENRVSFDSQDTPVVERSGNVCTLTGECTFLVTPTSAQTSIILLPTDCKPIKNGWSVAYRLSDGKIFPLQVSETGNVNILNHGQITTGDTFYIGITYIV